MKVPSLAITAAPNIHLAHLWSYCFLGVGAFCAYDAYFSPLHKDADRCKELRNGLWATAIGVGLIWHCAAMMNLFKVG